MPLRELMLLKTEAIYAYNVELLLHNLSCDTKYYIFLPMEVIDKRMLQSFQEFQIKTRDRNWRGSIVVPEGQKLGL
jgi:hypothetical protein